MYAVDHSITLVLSVIQEGHAEVVNVLLDGANAVEFTPDGCTFLALAAEVSAV